MRWPSEWFSLTNWKKKNGMFEASEVNDLKRVFCNYFSGRNVKDGKLTENPLRKLTLISFQNYGDVENQEEGSVEVKMAETSPGPRKIGKSQTVRLI